MFHTGRDWPYLFGTLKDGCLKINSLSLDNCFSYETSCKMTSTLCQKFLKTFFCLFVCEKALNYLVQFGLYDPVWISPVCGPNTYQIMHGVNLDLGKGCMGEI